MRKCLQVCVRAHVRAHAFLAGPFVQIAAGLNDCNAGWGLPWSSWRGQAAAANQHCCQRLQRWPPTICHTAGILIPIPTRVRPAPHRAAEMLTAGKLSELAVLTLYLMYEKKVGEKLADDVSTGWQ
jgi:hypothetical protein